MRNAQRSDGIVARVAYKSVHFAVVPAGDEIVRKQIEAGKVRVVDKWLDADGKPEYLVVRFKGTPYRRPTPKAPSKRDLWRAR